MQGTPKHMAWRDLTRIRLASCTRLHLNCPGGAMVSVEALSPSSGVSHPLFSQANNSSRGKIWEAVGKGALLGGI